MFIGSRLKELRNERKMTQEELGNLLNVTKVSICCYEKGNRTPSLDTLDDLANIFAVRTDYFLGKDIPMVLEGTTEYAYYISSKELTFLKELRMNKELYNLVLEDPKRTVELIDKKLK